MTTGIVLGLLLLFILVVVLASSLPAHHPVLYIDIFACFTGEYKKGFRSS